MFTDIIENGDISATDIQSTGSIEGGSQCLITTVPETPDKIVTIPETPETPENHFVTEQTKMPGNNMVMTSVYIIIN